MLSLMRKNVQSFLIKGIIVIIVLAFIGTIFLVWGVGNEKGKNKKDVIATLFGEDVPYHEYSSEYRQLYDYYRNQFKNKWSSEMAERMQLKKTALDNVINRRIMTHEAIQQGILVTNKDVLNKIQSMKIFQQNGHFDSRRYDQILKYGMHMDSAAFENQIKKSLMIDRVRERIMAGIKVSRKEVLDTYSQRNEKVEADYVLLTPATFISQIAVSDDDVQHYFEKNKQNYELAKQRKISYIYVNSTKFKDSLSVDDKAVKQYYENHLTQYHSPKKVRARHILIKTNPGDKAAQKEEAKKKAEDLLKKIKAGEDFAKLAKKFSQDPGSAAKGGDLGYFEKGRMTPNFEKAAFALKKGQVSDLVETPYGYHIIKAEDVQEDRTKPLEEVKKQIQSKLLDEKAWEVAENKAYNLVRDFYKTGQLEELAIKAEYPIGETELAEDSKIIPNIGRSEELLKAAFSLEKNDVSTPIKANTGFYILRLIEEIPARVPELAKVKEKVTQDLKKERAEAKAKELADKVHSELAKVDLASLAKKYDLTVQNGGEISHYGFIKGLGMSREMANALFSLKKGQPTPVIKTNRGYAIAVLKKRIGVDLKKFAEEENKIREQTRRTKEQQILQSWLDRIKKKNNIIIDYSRAT